MNRLLRLAIPLVAVAVTPALVSCGGDSTASPPPPPAITVAVAPVSSTVPAGTTQALTATLQNDSSQRGVTWAISPASGAGTLSNASSTSVTYTAPASPPASDVIVTITATSVTEPARSAAAIIDFPAPLVVLDPSSATLDAGGSQTFTAAVEHEPTQMGVTWAISSASGAGTLTDATTTSVTYHAPASPPPGDLAVTITATSVADSLSSTSAPITVKAVTVAVAPATALVPATAQQSFTATVLHDQANQGVSWLLTQA